MNRFSLDRTKALPALAVSLLIAGAAVGTFQFLNSSRDTQVSDQGLETRLAEHGGATTTAEIESGNDYAPESTVADKPGSSTIGSEDLAADERTTNSEEVDPEPPLGVNEAIKFAPGTKSKIVSGTVTNGDTDVYRVEVADGQLLSVSMNPRGNRSVFDLYSPNNDDLAEALGATEVFDVETEAGLYLIFVKTSASRDDYEMTVNVI